VIPITKVAILVPFVVCTVGSWSIFSFTYFSNFGHSLSNFICHTPGTNDSSGDDEDSTNNKSNQYSYLRYWYHFYEGHRDRYQAMVGELPPDVFNETGTDSSLSVCEPSCSKKRKKTGVDSALSIYSTSQENNREFQKQVLVFQKEARDIQKERLATAREQLDTFRNVARVQAVKMWTLEVERYRQQRKTLKNSLFNHPKVEKQDYKSRLNGHKARVKRDGADANSAIELEWDPPQHQEGDNSKPCGSRIWVRNQIFGRDFGLVY
jgi:hypothetical protein